MDNKFFQFLEAYKNDIAAFIDALKAFIEAVLGKITGSEDDTAEPTE